MPVRHWIELIDERLRRLPETAGRGVARRWIEPIDSQAGDYEELAETFRWQVPEHFNIAVDVCGRWAEERSRFALYYEDESGFTSAHTFWDIQREANRLSNVLAALGTLPGDRVAVLLPQCPEAAIALVAICQMGAVAVPLSHRLGPDALAFRLGDRRAPGHRRCQTALPKLLPLRPDCRSCGT
jgi:acetyl-CoA synthetase